MTQYNSGASRGWQPRDRLLHPLCMDTLTKRSAEELASADSVSWHAVQARDTTSDGRFVYAVTSTGIYCRPSCPSRKPRRDRVRFFDAPDAARAAGFRACKRCKPDAALPADPWIERIRRACVYLSNVDGHPSLATLAARLGGSPYHLQRNFKRLVGVTPREYAEAVRLRKVKGRLRQPGDITGAMLDAGYGSSSRFYERAVPKLGMAPSVYRRGGIEPLETTAKLFDLTLRSESHTLKRALTDPRLFSGIGNAYSDEILHAARLSPMKLTSKLSGEESRRLYEATRKTLADWTSRIREETGAGFPEKVTAFRKGMAVHGRYGQPCPDCGSPVQRIAYAENEANYCATCQTGGRLLADRALSRLMHSDWPRTLEELEERKSKKF